MINPWHDVAIGKNVPFEVNVVIEVPQDGQLKYELDKESGLMKLDRPLYSAVHYPHNYGFIPQTFSEDNDPLDILVISNFSVFPNIVMRARPIGILRMRDNKETDNKILAVDASDPRFNEVQTIGDIPSHMRREIQHFFEIYKELQHKHVKVYRVEGLQAAHEEIKKAQKMYAKKFAVTKLIKK